MKHWFDLIRETLKVDWLESSQAPVPFGVRTTAGPLEFLRPTLTNVSGGHWQLRARSRTGVVVRWQMRFFTDTNAFECWGDAVNDGKEIQRGIIELATLDTPLHLPVRAGEPFLRTFHGARFVPNTFPVHDFACVDQQLIRTRQSWQGVEIGADDHGRSSGKNLPFAFFSNQAMTRGAAFAYGWSGQWKMSFLQKSCEFGEKRNPWAVGVMAALSGLNLDLAPGESLPLPRLAVVFYKGGWDQGSNSLRRHVRHHVTPRLNGEEMRPPVSFNHWFAFENSFTSDLLKPAVDACARAGVEYFCVDAAWFTGDFRNGIGNWDREDERKFPQGVAEFSGYVQKSGMKYGSWFEPEWAYKDSDVFRQHPEWFLPTPPTYPPFAGPSTFFNPGFHLMNFGLKEVQDWWIARLQRAYRDWSLRWVRWDFNQVPRPNWENDEPVGRRGWNQIRHHLGLYRVLDEIIKTCPDLLIEQCASGGHRIDLGTARRGHTYWMNDHTMHSETILSLQVNLNRVLPGNYANTNLCQNRHNYTDYDFLAHGCGGFGYSGKLWQASRGDFARYAAAVDRFKKYRHLLMGDFEPPLSPICSTGERVQVGFKDGNRSIRMDFNSPGGRRRAKISARGWVL